MFFEAVVYLLLALLGYGALKFFLGGQNSLEVPPGRRGWPLLGETLEFLHPVSLNSIGKFLQERRSRYGEVFKSHVFGCPTIFSCDSEFNSFILQNEGKLFCSSYPRQMRKILGESSIIYLRGEHHKRIRSPMVRFINSSRVSPDFLLYLEKLSIRTMESWNEEGRRELHFFEEAKQFTFRLLLRNLLDIDGGDTKTEIQEDLCAITKGFTSLPIYLPGNSYAEAIKAITRLSSTLKGIISERQKKVKACSSEESTCILEEICVNGQFNVEEKVSILLDLLTGGFENPSRLMSLVVYFLARSPDILQTLREEHEILRRNKMDGEPLSLDDYKKMVFTSKVINETLRCGNIAGLVLRKALQDVKYKNFLIPSGWQVIPIFSATHLDPSLHKNPQEFDPSRWDDESTSRKVTPFGGGLRLCPGAELVKIQTAVFLHHFVTRFRWKIRDEECPLSFPYVEFKRGLVLELEPLTIR